MFSCMESEYTAPKDSDEVARPVEMPCEGYELGFPVVLDDIPSGVDEEIDYDDYVETKDHFRIFFFDKDGNFLVNTMDRTVTPLGTDDKGRKKFYVRVPVNYIIDREDKVIDVEAFKNKLKSDNFKIAVLANWPNPEGSTDENASFNEQNPRDPNWGWKNSILNPNVEDLKTINDFHHLQYYYEGIYSVYAKDGKISKTVDWVDSEGNGKMLSEQYNILIPMYGVQDFPALKNWQEGSTYNLSGESDTDDNSEKNIYLLRSVAKIEVYLPQKPIEIKIHNINRSARCEPMDVFTPTNKIWLKEDEFIDHTSQLIDDNNDLNSLCEWYRIGNHGLYSTSSSKDNWLPWFYSSWHLGVNNESDTSIDLSYPHIFNENIDNVESVSMTWQRSTGEGELYVIYVAEKYMDAYSLDESSEPLIPYVEFKYNDSSSISRFYLTDTQPSSTNIEDVVKAPLWPIMRNHVYSFYVSEGGIPTILEIRARVADWGYHRLNNEW